MAEQTRLPTGDGGTSNWTALGGGAKYVEVDDPIGAPDDDTSYVKRLDSASTQQFTHTATKFTVPAGATVAYLRNVVRARCTAAGPVTIRPGIVVRNPGDTGNVAHDAVGSATTTTYAEYTADWLTNPQTGGAWTPAQVNDTAATGGRYVTMHHLWLGGIVAGEEIRCTQDYILVSYTAAGDLLPRRLVCQHAVTRANTY